MDLRYHCGEYGDCCLLGCDTVRFDSHFRGAHYFLHGREYEGAIHPFETVLRSI
jgi:hypothetical protein